MAQMNADEYFLYKAAYHYVVSICSIIPYYVFISAFIITVQHKLTDGQGGDKSGIQLMSNQGLLLRSAIPYLPLPVSCLCLILNCILPGAGESLVRYRIIALWSRS